MGYCLGAGRGRGHAVMKNKSGVRNRKWGGRLCLQLKGEGLTEDVFEESPKVSEGKGLGRLV